MAPPMLWPLGVKTVGNIINWSCAGQHFYAAHLHISVTGRKNIHKEFLQHSTPKMLALAGQNVCLNNECLFTGE